MQKKGERWGFYKYITDLWSTEETVSQIKKKIEFSTVLRSNFHNVLFQSEKCFQNSAKRMTFFSKHIIFTWRKKKQLFDIFCCVRPCWGLAAGSLWKIPSTNGTQINAQKRNLFHFCSDLWTLLRRTHADRALRAFT